MDIETRRLIRVPEVLALIGVSRSTLYAMVAEGQFPRPVKIGHRSVGWPARDVQSWLDNRPVAKAPTPGDESN